MAFVRARRGHGNRRATGGARLLAFLAALALGLLRQMLGKDIVRIVLYGVGISSLASLIYLGGPLIAIGEYHPLENYIIRQIAILLLVSAAAGIGGFKFWQRRKKSKEIAELKSRYEKLKKARDILATDPTDGSSNHLLRGEA